MSTVSKHAQSPAQDVPHDGLRDERGPIPMFLPRALDEKGRLVPISEEERAARSDAAIRAIAALRRLPDDDPPDTEEKMMRGIDENRPAGATLFEGLS